VFCASIGDNHPRLQRLVTNPHVALNLDTSDPGTKISDDARASSLDLEVICAQFLAQRLLTFQLADRSLRFVCDQMENLSEEIVEVDHLLLRQVL
jgi:hypothetical protein